MVGRRRSGFVSKNHIVQCQLAVLMAYPPREMSHCQSSEKHYPFLPDSERHRSLSGSSPQSRAEVITDTQAEHARLIPGRTGKPLAARGEIADTELFIGGVGDEQR